MENVYCPKCNQKAWSIADINYIRMFPNCWYCDKEKWEKKEMTTEVFEDRELRASK